MCFFILNGVTATTRVPWLPQTGNSAQGSRVTHSYPYSVVFHITTPVTTVCLGSAGAVVDTHLSFISRQAVPLFATLLFARDTSSTPRELMVNHLNHVGDSGGLEQVST